MNHTICCEYSRIGIERERDRKRSNVATRGYAMIDDPKRVDGKEVIIHHLDEIGRGVNVGRSTTRAHQDPSEFKCFSRHLPTCQAKTSRPRVCRRTVRLNMRTRKPAAGSGLVFALSQFNNDTVRDSHHWKNQRLRESGYLERERERDKNTRSSEQVQTSLPLL